MTVDVIGIDKMSKSPLPIFRLKASADRTLHHFVPKIVVVTVPLRVGASRVCKVKLLYRPWVQGHYSATLRMKMHIACVGKRLRPTPANVQNTSLHSLLHCNQRLCFNYKIINRPHRLPMLPDMTFLSQKNSSYIFNEI